MNIKMSQRGLTPKDVAAKYLANIFDTPISKEEVERVTETIMTDKQFDKVTDQITAFQERMHRPVKQHLERSFGVSTDE